ncbi:SAM-dependent methyltransferase [Spirillospora sp. NPDC047418]
MRPGGAQERPPAADCADRSSELPRLRRPVPRTAGRRVRRRAALTPGTRAEIERFFDGFELVEPGLADVRAWRSGGQAGDQAGDHVGELPGLPWTTVGGVGRLL